MKKRICVTLALLLSFVLIAAVIPQPKMIDAETLIDPDGVLKSCGLVVSCSPMNVRPGDNFSATISFTGSVTFRTLSIMLYYNNSYFETRSYSLGALGIQLRSHMASIGGSFSFNPNTMLMQVSCPSATTATMNSGELFTANLRVKNNTPYGQYTFSPSYSMIFGPSGQISYSSTTCTLTVSSGANPTPGPTPTPDPSIGHANISVSNATAEPGETVHISVNIEGEYEAHGITIYVSFDPNLLTIESLAVGSATLSVNGGWPTLMEMNQPGNIVFSLLCPMSGLTENGELFSMDLTVGQQVPVGSVIPIVIDVTDLYNLPVGGSRHDIPHTDHNGSITVFNAGAFIPGDVDGNGSVTVADAITVLRAAMGLVTLTPEQLAPADITGDGNIAVADAIMVLRRAMGVA